MLPLLVLGRPPVFASCGVGASSGGGGHTGTTPRVAVMALGCCGTGRVGTAHVVCWRGCGGDDEAKAGLVGSDAAGGDMGLVTW